MAKLERGLAISQIIISALCLLAILAIWIAMHVYGMTFSNADVYYINISAAVPLGILLILSILVLVRSNKKK